MFSSIQCAARWDGWHLSLTHIALVLGDQPHVRTATLRSFLDRSARAADAICQPQFRGRLHHPVLFPRSRFLQLADSAGPTLKDFLRGQQVAACPVDDEGLELDLDHPEDYARALELSRFAPPGNSAATKGTL
jgi:CTP:molybdopterin cytidylyltransferase MocA